MPRPKSTIKQTMVDVALKSHNCQHDEKHRIEKGQKRLKIRNDRNFENYCIDCGKRIITDDIEKLKALMLEF